MTSQRSDDSLAGRIVGASRIIRLADAMVARAVADARSSRTLALLRNAAAAFRAQPPRSRRAALVVAAMVASSGYLLIAPMLPARSQPVPALAAVAGLAAILAGAATIARNR